MSFTPTGTPFKGRSPDTLSTSRAVFSAPSRSSVSHAWTSPSTASIRSSSACTISRGDTSRWRTSRASSDAVAFQRGSAAIVGLLVEEIERLLLDQPQPVRDVAQTLTQLGCTLFAVRLLGRLLKQAAKGVFGHHAPTLP